MSHDIEIIGDGCAALSFAARASEVNGNVTLIKPNNAPPAKDHVWGFWSDPILQDAQKWLSKLGKSGRLSLMMSVQF